MTVAGTSQRVSESYCEALPAASSAGRVLMNPRSAHAARPVDNPSTKTTSHGIIQTQMTQITFEDDRAVLLGGLSIGYEGM